MRKQLGSIVNDLAIQLLLAYCDFPVKHTTSIWKHKSNSITFTFACGNIGIKYTNHQYLHPIEATSSLYICTINYIL